MQLTYFPGTISVAAILALEEAGLEYEAVKVDFKEAEQTKPAYHAINPKGRVPALVTNAGVLTETGAILEYVAALAPQAGLVPTDPLLAGHMREAMYYFASTMHVNHAHKMRGSRWASQQASFEDMTAKVPETMAASAAYISENGLKGPFVLGDEISIADCYLFVVCSWLEGDGVSVADYPKIRDFMATMDQRPSVRAVRAKGML